MSILQPRAPMRIIDQQQRIYEVGRLRTGERRGGKGEPRRIDAFRFTTTSRRAIDKAAQVYGGTPREWKDAPTAGKQWELYTDAAELEVVMPPTYMAMSQSFEVWSGGGCQRRCDGRLEYLSGNPCLCAAEMEAEEGTSRLCRMTTRLNVMLPRLGSFGVWRLETKSENAGHELAGAAQLALMAQQEGKLNGAWLRIDPRTGKRPKPNGDGMMTVHYNVPVLDVDLPLEALLPAGSHLARELAPPPDDTHELEQNGGASAHFTPVDRDALPPGPQPSLRQQNDDTKREPAPRSNAAEPVKRSGRKPRKAAGAAQPSENEAPPPAEEDAPEPPDDDQARKERARNIAIAAGNAGLDDDGRHRFLHAASGGAYASAKEVPPEHVAQIMAGLTKLRRGDIELVEVNKAWVLRETATGERAGPDPNPQGALDVGAQDDQQDEPRGVWDRERWLAACENVKGVGQVKLLKQARAIAQELDIDVPASLDECTNEQLGTQLLQWLREQQEGATHA